MKPHLIVYSRLVTKAGSDTRQKGTLREVTETIDVSDRLTSKVKRDALLIIDLLDMQVVKNSTGLDRTVALADYTRRYAEEIAQGVDRWLIRKEKQKNVKR